MAQPQLRPLEQWVCDSCNQIINRVQDGWFEWYDDSNNQQTGFRIVHNNHQCMYNTRTLFAQGRSTRDMHLDAFVGGRGLVYLLSLIEHPEVTNKAEVTEMVRRLHVAHYEEARLYWPEAESDGFFDGANEIWPYLPETNETLIRRYSDERL
ncbi:MULTISPECIES: hypothetical protein [unclassified Paenibacillus]|uniref:hypothetical protein n=1 Tax=unclassified Paenibacillus TaxID=185978 RepID=UPI00240536D6|nr:MULTISPECIES: hypothetical protein [unclassified Paenibacillus]MDF9844962.1 hypothetical protein [Paenibacillus sp. PastF-2]MDF9851561.1 hypothetical protein [Paenibacillus sp. PastM-2]MDF9858145.1 hypothetical protein [Paenibacillus sp. PastF-1]MDH6483371.1 hypothetical protein [Paenibacillus sp. PastH-2]MDH6510821.1 hypothetical protein [Paenibacillus sp. PastM-3]